MLLTMCGKQLRLQKSDFKMMGITCLAAIALMELIVNLVMALGDPEDYFMLAPFITFAMVCIFGLVTSTAFWNTTFPMGLRMGATRREMVAGTLFLTAVMNGFLLLFAALHKWLEETFGVGYWVEIRGKELELDVLYSLPWWGWPLALAVCTVAGLLMGTLVLRFGRKGFWVLWTLWMLACLGPQWFLQVVPDFGIPIIGTPLWNTMPFWGTAVVLALCILAVRTLLKLPVREGS